ncbi:MAG TPA: hypothetical protein VL049_05575 [Candidatus Dormibacteraeota bacterium]|nr:hypothetical protein [Candidatus Dormibacteraeota bacterium]
MIPIGQMWAELVQWARSHMLRPDFQLVSEADLEIPQCVATAGEAVTLLRQHHAQWAAELADAQRKGAG